MLFGYLTAVMAGFLLTAVRNWTGMPTATGAPLAALVGLWLAGRLAPWLDWPTWLIVGIDLAFLPALALALQRPLWHGPNPVNRVFPALLAAMTLANALVHLGALGLLAGGETRGHRLMLDLMLVVVLLPTGYQTWLMAGGLCWIAAFALFLWVHAPMLLTARPDGRPG